MTRFLLASCAVCCSTLALADGPKVATDIAPVHSLVAQVMDGVAKPDLVVRPGQSPHGYALRPSEARALQEADLVVWVGADLTPWLDAPLASLASDAMQLRLMGVPGVVSHPYRDVTMPGHAEPRDHDDPGHEAGHDHDESHDPDRHTEDGHDHDDHHDAHDADHHDHDGTDPHAWLDPVNAGLWLEAIAETLAGIDPDNAATYRGNARTARVRIDALARDVEVQLAPMRDRPFVAFHDAYQYFEHRFGLTLAGTVALSDARDPGPARLAHLRDRMQQLEVGCAFSEPQFNTQLIETVAEGAEVRLIELDPLGVSQDPGPDLYEGLLLSMADAFASCAAP